MPGIAWPLHRFRGVEPRPDMPTARVLASPVPSRRKVLAADSRSGQHALDAPEAQSVHGGERRRGGAGDAGLATFVRHLPQVLNDRAQPLRCLLLPGTACSRTWPRVSFSRSRACRPASSATSFTCPVAVPATSLPACFTDRPTPTTSSRAISVVDGEPDGLADPVRGGENHSSRDSIRNPLHKLCTRISA